MQHLELQIDSLHCIFSIIQADGDNSQAPPPADGPALPHAAMPVGVVTAALFADTRCSDHTQSLLANIAAKAPSDPSDGFY